MKLVFLPEAVQDIDRLYDFLVAKKPIVAQSGIRIGKKISSDDK